MRLQWHVDPPYFPIGRSSSIKLNDMDITDTEYQDCSGDYPMMRGSGRSHLMCCTQDGIDMYDHFAKNDRKTDGTKYTT